MVELIVLFSVFFLSVLIGYVLISRVPPLLHTPLMSMTDAISAVTILGALLIFSESSNLVGNILGVIAIVTAIFNVVGGFVITDRMLKLFRKENSK